MAGGETPAPIPERPSDTLAQHFRVYLKFLTLLQMGPSPQLDTAGVWVLASLPPFPPSPLPSPPLQEAPRDNCTHFPDEEPREGQGLPEDRGKPGPQGEERPLLSCPAQPPQRPQAGAYSRQAQGEPGAGGECSQAASPLVQ